MKSIAIYPGSFDPITNGHVELIKQATQLFDQVIVAVATNARKAPWLKIEERLTLAQEVLNDCSSVKVLSCTGLVVDFARQYGAKAIVRGLRTAADYEDEFQLAGMNQQMAPEIISVFLTASTKYAFISATLVREIVTLGGDVSLFVPLQVIQKIKQWQK